MHKTLMAALVAAAPSLTLAAEDSNRFYAAFNFGQSLFDDSELRGSNVAGARRDIDISLEEDGFLAASLGVVANDGEYGRLRFEAEFAQHEADVDDLLLNGVPRSVRGGSDVSATTGMINAVYDTPLFAERFRGFAGVGFGVGSIDHEVRYLVERPAAAGGDLAIAIPSTETTYSYQFMVGAEAMLTERFSVVLDARFVDFGDTQAERYVLTSGALDSVLDNEISTTAISLGLRYQF